jgi:hypothetical protein
MVLARDVLDVSLLPLAILLESRGLNIEGCKIKSRPRGPTVFRRDRVVLPRAETYFEPEAQVRQSHPKVTRRCGDLAHSGPPCEDVDLPRERSKDLWGARWLKRVGQPWRKSAHGHAGLGGGQYTFWSFESVPPSLHTEAEQ